MAGSTLVTKSVRLQTEYLGTRMTKVTVHGVPVDISGDRLGTFFSQYGYVEEVSAITGKTGIATGEFVLQVTLTRKGYNDIPNTLMCWERIIPVVVMRCNGTYVKGVSRQESGVSV